jgi:hypothetical protein
VLRPALTLAVLLCACATTAPAEKTAAEPPPPLGDRYEVKFPGAPQFERGAYGADVLNTFKLADAKVEYELAYVTIAALRENPAGVEAAVDARIKDTLSTHGIRKLATEAVTVPNADFARSFVGTREGQTVAGIGCAAGDRLYVVMTQIDQSDAAQVAAAAAFRSSFRP